jgi:hypothetical protein
MILQRFHQQPWAVAVVAMTRLTPLPVAAVVVAHELDRELVEHQGREMRVVMDSIVPPPIFDLLVAVVVPVQ